jgi:hypothetical protein
MRVPGKFQPKFTDQEQSVRFIEAARELGAEESGAEFDRALNSILKQKTDGISNRKPRREETDI